MSKKDRTIVTAVAIIFAVLLGYGLLHEYNELKRGISISKGE